MFNEGFLVDMFEKEEEVAKEVKKFPSIGHETFSKGITHWRMELATWIWKR